MAGVLKEPYGSARYVRVVWSLAESDDRRAERSSHGCRKDAQRDARHANSTAPAQQGPRAADAVDPPAQREPVQRHGPAVPDHHGARSGQRRTSPVAYFSDGAGGWFIVASAGGSVRHPGWYHNIAAHPDSVTAEVSGTTHRVRVEQLEGEPRERAWAEIVSRAPRYESYRSKTDRQIPVLRLTLVP
jgi:deazaflavin-dependent oxidoreductase (nitroreductase family)